MIIKNPQLLKYKNHAMYRVIASSLYLKDHKKCNSYYNLYKSRASKSTAAKMSFLVKACNENGVN